MLGEEEKPQEPILQQQSSIWQLALPYNNQKNSVLILLIQIFYVVTISILILLGMFFLFSSSSSSSYDNELKKVVNQWNTTILPQLKELTIRVSSGERSIRLRQNETNWYSSRLFDTPFSFYSADVGTLLEKATFSKKYNDILSDSYNLTIPISLNISGTIVNIKDIDGIIKTRTVLGKQECLKNKFVYNEESGICYQFFTLRSICLVIDANVKELIYDYKVFKCNKFTQWYESFKILKWPFPDTDPGKNQIKDQGLIDIRVLSSLDPYVWDSYNKEGKDQKNDSYSTVGIWMVMIAIGLIFVGLWFYFKELNEKEKARIGNIRQHQNQTMQMAEFTESSESDTKVRIPIGIPNPLLK